jgi:hypothetical protein
MLQNASEISKADRRSGRNEFSCFIIEFPIFLIFGTASTAAAEGVPPRVHHWSEVLRNPASRMPVDPSATRTESWC